MPSPTHSAQVNGGDAELLMLSQAVYKLPNYIVQVKAPKNDELYLSLCGSVAVLVV